MKHPSPPSVFISYALADRTQVKKLFDELKSVGVIGQRDQIVDHAKIIVKGPSRRDDVRKAIEDASKIIVIWSSGGAESEWVNYEIAMADALGKQIIVVVPKGERSPIPDQIAENTIFEMDSVGQLTPGSSD
jgi:hypothetical protein